MQNIITNQTLFTVALAKHLGVRPEEILFTDVIAKVEFEEDKDIIDRIITINDIRLRNDYILNFFAGAIVDVVKANNLKVRKFYKGKHTEKENAKIIQIGNKTYTRTFEFIDDTKLSEAIMNLRLKSIQKELEKNSNTLVLRYKVDVVNLNDCTEGIAIKSDKFSYSLYVDGVVVVKKAYLYKDETAITKADKINLIDIKFKRSLKKNDEYVRAYKN